MGESFQNCKKKNSANKGVGEQLWSILSPHVSLPVEPLKCFVTILFLKFSIVYKDAVFRLSLTSVHELKL